MEFKAVTPYITVTWPFSKGDRYIQVWLYHPVNMVRFSLAMGGRTHIILLRQPRPQGPLAGQNGGSAAILNAEKTLGTRLSTAYSTSSPGSSRHSKWRLACPTSFPGLFPFELGRREKGKSPGNEIVACLQKYWRFRLFKIGSGLCDWLI